jgi:DNA-binding transcriptional ArsR family regulator
MTYDRLFRAMADPTRRTILERLRRGPLSVGTVASGLPVSRPAVSQHLAVLKEAGLVRERREGSRRIYSAEPQGLRLLENYVQELWSDLLEEGVRAAPEQRAEEERVREG